MYSGFDCLARDFNLLYDNDMVSPEKKLKIIVVDGKWKCSGQKRKKEPMSWEIIIYVLANICL